MSLERTDVAFLQRLASSRPIGRIWLATVEYRRADAALRAFWFLAMTDQLYVIRCFPPWSMQACGQCGDATHSWCEACDAHGVRPLRPLCADCDLAHLCCRPCSGLGRTWQRANAAIRARGGLEGTHLMGTAGFDEWGCSEVNTLGEPVQISGFDGSLWQWSQGTSADRQ